nr:NACHT, LRR and PYD domains-containing protein 14-like [Nerophis lumbriciformis]
MALDSRWKELLLKTLMELGEDDFEYFKFYTDLPTSVRENARRVNIADKLVMKYGAKTLDETIKILEKIDNKNLAEMLRRNMLEIKGAVFSVHDEDQIARLKVDLQGNMRSSYSFVPEGNTERWKQQQPLADVYSDLDITYGADVSPDKRHEVLQMETCATAAKESILPCDIFQSPDGKQRPIRTLLTVGFAGIGKTFLLQKFVWDWASGNTNQDIHFIFPFTFRELNTDKGKSFTLAELIRRYVCESRHMSEETLNEIFANLQTSGKRDYESSGIKILFVFDGLDECNFKIDLKNEMKVDMDVTQACPLEVLLAHLIKRNLLPCARVWITTRPTTAHDIPSNLIDSRTEVKGFSDSQRLEYFRKRFPNEERVTKHIRKSRTIFIMCHLPIFCWLTATVLQDHLDKENEEELPTTLTDMLSEYALNQFEKSNERQMTEYIHYVKALAKLAFDHTMSNQQIFFEKQLVESGFDYSQAAKHCGIFTEVLKEVRPLRRNQQGKMFQFVHLTIQEYLAAFYVMMSLFHDNKNVLADSDLAPESEEEEEVEGDWKITEVHRSALQRASECEGNLDLFVRFLFGLSLPCNQELLGELLKVPRDFRQSKSKTVKLIKKTIRRNTPEKNVNLFYCLNELKDDSLLKHIQEEIGYRSLSWIPMTNEMWSALAFFLLTDEETMKSFDLRKYDPSPLALEKLLVVVKASEKSVLFNCDLNKHSCHLLASLLSAPSNLRQLVLTLNNLSDEGVEILSKGLASPHCLLQVLVLDHCGITARGCVSLAGALKLHPSQLQEMRLSNNELSDEGVEILSKGLASPHCIIKVLELEHCSITKRGCVSLAEALKLNPSHLQELDLSYNNLSDDGVDILSKGLASPHCILQVLNLSNCNITKRGCISLAEALKFNRSHLQELRLSHNDLSDEGVEILSKGLASQHCILQILELSWCKITNKGCVSLAEALKLNPSHLQQLILVCNPLGEEGKRVLMDVQQDPSYGLMTVRSLGVGATGKAVSHEKVGVQRLHYKEVEFKVQVYDAATKLLTNPEGLLQSVLAVLLHQLNLKDWKSSCPNSNSVFNSRSFSPLSKAIVLRCTRVSEGQLSTAGFSSQLSIQPEEAENELSDEAVEILSKGLASPHCILESLEMVECGITDKGCFSLAEAFKLYPSSLEALDLSKNNLLDEWVEILSKGLASPNCNLKMLRLQQFGITKLGCVFLAEALKLNTFYLEELNLSKNNLLDERVEILSKGLASPNCNLEILRVQSCGITKRGCVFLAEALKSNPSHPQVVYVKCIEVGPRGMQAFDDIKGPSFRLVVN